MRKILFLLLLLTCTWGAQQSEAAIIAYEGFNYTSGSNLSGQSGGGSTGFSGVWAAGAFNAAISNHLTIESDSLLNPGVTSTGGRATSIPQSGLAGLVRPLSTPLATSNGSVYFSYLIRPESQYDGSAFNNFIGLTFETPSAELFVGRPSTSNEWVLENRGGGGQNGAGFAPVVGETALLVVRADFVVGIALDKFTLYVNPTPGSEPINGGIVKQDLNIGFMTGIGIYSAGGFSIDEIRIGTTYADVVPVTAVPEPASIFLLVVFGGCAAIRRWSYRSVQ